MTQPAKAQEPSMEEILASIRRIIADDDTVKPPPKAPDPPPAPPPRPARPIAPPEPVMKEEDDLDTVLGDLEPPMPAPPMPAPVAAEKLAPDVLDLTEDMAASAIPPADSFRKIDGESDVVFEDRPDDRLEPMLRAPVEAPPERPLLSTSTSAAVDSAFNTLAQTVLVQNARTLEDLVKEMLRPLLKTWLDDNLPGLVERLVRAEIERVSRGRS
jgi:uncharacterized protein